MLEAGRYPWQRPVAAALATGSYTGAVLPTCPGSPPVRLSSDYQPIDIFPDEDAVRKRNRAAMVFEPFWKLTRLPMIEQWRVRRIPGN